jgi:hypothetical protein
MAEMRINPKKLPIKYFLDIYQEIPSYPNNDDLQYILLRTLQDKNLLGKSFTAENVWIGMRNALGTIQDLRNFLDLIFLSGDQTKFYLKGKKTSENSYQLESHEWMETN